ncbi:MAG TPA: sensor domain-containing diguanylate cyclase [Thermoanaerobaculia bacterium]|nr:sensor domain-containing diguanylate cyclase [Thermoanaerobaculia bacterium]
MIETYTLDIPELARFLQRYKASSTFRTAYDLDVLLRQILEKAFEFVPSESGSMLLDDPSSKVAARVENELVFIASFGRMGKEVIGQRMSARNGIAGRVYETGIPYLSTNVSEDAFFFPHMDAALGHKTHSIVCVPIYLGSSVCGVIELINRLEGRSFTERDMTLLEIFAGYTSFTLHNALDAKRAHELAKRDDLTGLYNDRWFNVRLTETLTVPQVEGLEAVLIFLDLDHFKGINDAHGHLAGSQVLREVGFLLRRIIDSEEATLARYGGDEFLVLFPQITLDAAVEAAETIRAAVEEYTFLSRDFGFGTTPINLSGAITASIGVAQYRRPLEELRVEQEMSTLMKRADAAMYKAKASGGNRVVVSSD